MILWSIVSLGPVEKMLETIKLAVSNLRLFCTSGKQLQNSSNPITEELSIIVFGIVVACA